LSSKTPSILVKGERVEGKLILFDVDGTLVDDADRYRALARSRMRAIEETLGKKTAFTWAKLEGVDTDAMDIDMNGPLSKAPRKEDLTIAAVAIYLAGYSWYKAKELAEKIYQDADRIQAKTYKPRFFLSVREKLTDLRGRGFKLGIVTNGQTNLTIEALKVMKAFSLFDVIVGADMVQEPKPSPDMILKACEIIGVNPVDSIYVGDQHTDVQAGINAGVRYIIGVGSEAEGTKHKVSSVTELE
jgi:phosphoglycolate phosphatase